MKDIDWVNYIPLTIMLICSLALLGKGVEVVDWYPYSAGWIFLVLAYIMERKFL